MSYLDIDHLPRKVETRLDLSIELVAQKPPPASNFLETD